MSDGTTGTRAEDAQGTTKPGADGAEHNRHHGDTKERNGIGGASGFVDAAKMALRPFIDKFGEGELDEAELLFKADEVAEAC